MLGRKILTRDNLAIFTVTFVIFPKEQIVNLRLSHHTAEGDQ